MAPVEVGDDWPLSLVEVTAPGRAFLRRMEASLRLRISSRAMFFSRDFWDGQLYTYTECIKG